MAEEPNSNAPAAAAQVDDHDHDRGLFDLPDFGALGNSFTGWCRANPMGAVLLVLLFAVIGYFYFGVKAFLSLSQSPAQWIASTWNAENDQQHCFAIIPIAIFLVLLRWRDLQAAPKEPANSGLWWVGLGVLAYIAGIRCVEGRYTIVALVLFSYGITRFLFGRHVARIVLFPCAFLLFMVPVGAVVQGTAGLQSKTAKMMEVLCSLTGIRIHANGATIYSSDGKFEPLEVAGGCSGIRSLMAMIMLAALYAYFVMRTPLRGFILLGCSLFFALIGNFFRVFSVVLVARFIGPGAAHSYHDWSGFVFFPVAVLAMVGVGNLLNRDWGARRRIPLPASATVTASDPSPADPVAPVGEPQTPASPEPPKPQATYDY
jgi:exosortase